MGLGLGINLNKGGATESWTPLVLGSTLDLWLQYNTGITSDGGSPDLVSQWADQSGNSRHATQSTDAAKPSVTSGYLDFEDTSVNDYMDIATGTGALGYGHPNPFTIVIALRREDAGTDRFIGSTSAEFVGLVGDLSKIQTRAAGTNGALVVLTMDDDYFTTGSDYILTVTKDSSGNILVYKNSDVLAESGGGTSQQIGTDMDLTFIGSSVSSDHVNAFDGRIYEVIVCDTVLSTSDRNSTIDYLTGKLGF